MRTGFVDIEDLSFKSEDFRFPNALFLGFQLVSGLLRRACLILRLGVQSTVK